MSKRRRQVLAMLGMSACACIGIWLGVVAGGLGRASSAQDDQPRLFTEQYKADEAAVKKVRRCGTEVPSAYKIARMRDVGARFRTAAGALLRRLGDAKVKVAFHVIHSGNNGKLDKAQLDRQINDLNDAYKGKGFQFELDSAEFVDVEGTDREAWFHITPDSSEERAAKRALGKDPERFLNLYTADLGDGLLGWARFPSDLAGDPELDGVVILYSSLREADGSPGPAKEFGLGKTAVHECGHWLGLFHTFQGGCQPAGDDVEDTPYQFDGNNIFQCDESLDTCPDRPGKDPVHNYMNYADDRCLTQFTDGQVQRMRDQVGAFRPHLLEVPREVRDELRAARARALSR